MTIKEAMTAASNRPSGFDYLRLILATSVILWHSFGLTDTREVAEQMLAGPALSLVALILPMFFSLSGFLVAGSLERNHSLISFSGLRVVRLIPALAVETTLSALVLGPIFTVFTASEYFHDPMFRSYFLNILGRIHYFLPGTFLNNPYDRTVNGQLWTVPFELKCYVYLAAVAALGIASRRLILLGALILAQAGAGAYLVLGPHPTATGIASGTALVGCFFAGLALFKFRDAVPLRAGLAILSLVLTEVLSFAPGGYYFICLPVSYLTVYLGTLNPKKTWFVSSGDYSYGIFLYGWPIQQAISSLGTWTYHPWLNFLCAYPITFGIAFLSWRYVEKPAFHFKVWIYRLEKWLLQIPMIHWHSQVIFRPRNVAFSEVD